MRSTLLLACLTLTGCGVSQHAVSADVSDTPPADLRIRKTGDDWPCFLGPTQDGVSKEKGILTPWPKAGPDVVWTKIVGTGYAGPVVSRGRLYFFDRVGKKARLRALNAETGEELWSFDYATDYRDAFGYNNGPRCCPVVDGDRVYVFGPEGMLYCVSAKDGKEVWKSDTQKDFRVVANFFGVGSTPVVEKDLLIVQIGGSPKNSDKVAFDDLKGDGSAVVAFDKRTGKVKWKTSYELASYASPTVRTIGKRRFCFVFARGGLIALDPETGKADFHYPWRANLLESANASNPVVVGNRVLISECYQLGSALLEVKPGGYKEVWTDKDKGLRTKSLMSHWMTPIHVDGHVYGSSGRHENAELRCVELTTGKVTWKERNLTRCSLMLVDGHFVCLGEDGWLRLLKVNATKYEEISSVQLRKVNKNNEPDEDSPPLLGDRECWAAPILSNGLMYLRGQQRLVCVRLIPEKKK